MTSPARTKPPLGRGGARAAKPAGSSEPNRSEADRRSGHLPAIVLVVAVLITFGRVCTFEFTNWDDQFNVTRNPHLLGQTLAGLIYFWRHAYASLYIPLTYTIWWVLAWVGRVDTPDAVNLTLNPYVFHTANLLLHLAAALMAYRLLRLLTGRAWPAFAGAAVFALHPFQVEPVAWVTGLKDVLSGACSLLALWQYALFAKSSGLPTVSESVKIDAAGRRRGRWHYATATIALVAAMFSKPSAIAIPLMAAAIDLWVVRRPLRRVALSVAPWCVLAAVVVLIGLLNQTASDVDAGPAAMRPLIAAHSLAFYLIKLVAPLRLSPMYPESPRQVADGIWVWAAWILPATLLAALWALRRRAPWALAAAAIFVLAPAPVLGLVPYDYEYISTVADRYEYVGMLGPALAVAFLLSSASVRAIPTRRHIAMAATSVALVLFAALSFVDAGHWHDSTALFRHAAAEYPEMDLPYTNLCQDAINNGRIDEAIELARQGVARNPKRVQCELALGYAFQQADRHAEAGVAFLKASELEPKNLDALGNLAIELAAVGQPQKALAIAQFAMAQYPEEGLSHRCMAATLLKIGNSHAAEALREAQTAVRLDPAVARSHLTLAEALAANGREAEAQREFTVAVTMGRS